MTEEIKDEITWKKFVSMYAKQHTVTYAQALKECAGPDGVWAKYKVENKIVPKPRVKKPAQPKVPKEKEVAEPQPKVVKKAKAKPKAKPAPKRKVVKVQAPPKGKRMVVTYVDDDSSSDEDNVEVVDPEPASDDESADE